MALFSTLLLLITLSGCCFADNIEIERGVSFPTDDFLLPTSLCPSFRPLCSKFNAHQLGGCWSNFEDAPINCVLGSTVVFNSNPSRQCGFLSPGMFNCCRVCNLDHSTCVKNFPNDYYGVLPHCYRGSYKCMCKCLEKHNVPENYYQ